MRSIIVLVSLACAGLIGLAVFMSSRSDADAARIVPLSADYQKRQADGGWSKGAAEPLVTIEEYADIQCPACASFQPILTGALAQTSDYVKLVYRHYPLPQHSKARLAAQAVEAAGRQGKFFELQGSLFSSQQNWTSVTAPQFRQEILDRAEAIGMNMDQFRTDLNSSSVSADIDRDITKGNQLPVTETPTIVINGEKLPTSSFPSTVEQFVAILEQAKAKVETVVATPQPTPAQ
jgi:protein-disulfide isomerase